MFLPESLNLVIEEYSTLFPAFFWLGLRMVGGFNVGFVGIVSIEISALPWRYYESRCTHLRERVAPAVARLLRRT